MVAIVFTPPMFIDGPGNMGVIEYKVRLCLGDDNNGVRDTNGDEVS